MTSTTSNGGSHDHDSGMSVASTVATAATRITWPDGKLGPDVGTSAPRRIAPGSLVPGRWRTRR